MNKNKIVLVLYNIRSRFNVGAIFRTADAAGIDKIYLAGITPAPPHPKIDKISLGAEKTIPFDKIKQVKRLINKLKSEKYQIIALEQSRKSIPYYKFKPISPIAIIVGSEINGLNKNILKYCDKIIEIPMHGKKESLNVGIALGIALFEIIKT